VFTKTRVDIGVVGGTLENRHPLVVARADPEMAVAIAGQVDEWASQGLREQSLRAR